MSHEFKRIQKPQTFLVPINVKCDRCGENAKIIGAGLETAAWGQIEGYLQGGDEYRADLCQNCTKELFNWIDNNGGPGPQVGYQEPKVIDEQKISVF